MIINFKYGFEYNGFLFGWHKKKLYRLPSTSGNRLYGIKKLSPIKVGNHQGYRIKREKIAIRKLVHITTDINVAVKILKNKNIPLF